MFSILYTLEVPVMGSAVRHREYNNSNNDGVFCDEGGGILGHFAVELGRSGRFDFLGDSSAGV